MNATVEVVCYRSKVLANNESPLMLRVTKDRKRKYSSIGISINPVYWDFEKNKPRRNCPDKERIEQIIAEQVRNIENKFSTIKPRTRNSLQHPYTTGSPATQRSEPSMICSDPTLRASSLKGDQDMP